MLFNRSATSVEGIIICKIIAIPLSVGFMLSNCEENVLSNSSAIYVRGIQCHIFVLLFSRGTISVQVFMLSNFNAASFEGIICRTVAIPL